MESNKADTFNKIVLDNCSCPICFEEFTRPKSLPSCCHSYCDGCLGKLLKRPSVTIPHPHILCPLCQKVSQVSEGINNLPVNPILVALLEHTPAAETRNELYRCLDSCNSELSKSSSQIETIVSRVDTFKQHVQTQKERVVIMAGMLKEEIDKKANKILQALDSHAARLDEWTDEYQCGKDECSDTIAKYKRLRTVIKNESADRIVNNKMTYKQQMHDLKVSACKKATKLVEEANLCIGHNDMWPKFIANEKLTEELGQYKIGYLDTNGSDNTIKNTAHTHTKKKHSAGHPQQPCSQLLWEDLSNFEKGCEEFDNLFGDQQLPQAAGNSHTVKKITYTREFLLQLRYHPVSLQEPEGLPNFLFIPRRHINNRMQPGASSWRFTPPINFNTMYERWSPMKDDAWS